MASTAQTQVEELLAVARLRDRLPTPRERRRIREQAGLSLREIAHAIDVSASAVALWETGKRQPRGSHLTAYVTLLTRLEER
jgi:DNA-binding transcriptional regulator YiaG